MNEFKPGLAYDPRKPISRENMWSFTYTHIAGPLEDRQPKLHYTSDVTERVIHFFGSKPKGTLFINGVSIDWMFTEYYFLSHINTITLL